MLEPVPFEIAVAEVSDLDGILELFTAVAGEDRWIATELPLDRDERRRRFAASIEAAGSIVLVARAAGAVIGHLSLQPQRPGLLGLGMMVAERWRARGVGSALLTEAVDRARVAGAYKISLEVFPHNPAALALYRRHGFAQEGYFRRHLRRADGQLWDVIPMGLLVAGDA